MGNVIHSTAVVEDGVIIGTGNAIEEYAVIRRGVEIGDDNRIGPFSLLQSGTRIGHGNTFHGYASVGSPGEMGSKGDVHLADGIVSIGNGNVVREFATINFPVRRPHTVIGDNCYLMARSHVPHDALLGNWVVMATNSLIGGGCTLGDFVYVGLNAHVHQWLSVGEGAMLGMSSATVKNVPPFVTVAGVPSRILRVNREGLRRRGIADEEADELEAFVAHPTGDPVGELSKAYAAFIRENEPCLTPA